MSKPYTLSDNITINPSGYTNLTSLTTTNSYPVTNGYTNTSSTTYARLSIASGATGHLYYTFDTSTIPENAEITGVSGQVKIRVNNTSYVTSTRCQLYAGTTAKGGNTTFASTSTSNIITLNTGTWTRTELENLRLYVGGTGGGNNNNSRYIYFYGANITISYTIEDIQYTITATSLTDEVTVDPQTQDILSNKSGTVSFYVNDISDYEVTDNDIDITSQLVRHTIDTSGTISATAESFTTGGSISTILFFTSSSNQGNNFNYAIDHTAESPGSTSSGSGSWTYVKESTESNASTTETGWAEYTFDFSSIPANSTINSIEIKCYGAVENSSQSTSHADITLFSGTTQKGTTQKFTSSTNSIITISDPGTWTRDELQNAILRFTVGYYGGHLFGITWTVNYEAPQTGNMYYYTYTLNNIADDHIIIVDKKGAYEPPEEDPEYTYWPITISSINAITDPYTGTTRVIEGTNQTVTITPSDPQLTLALDNGVDITSQLVSNIPSNTYTVTTQVNGASYGFNLNNSTGYYVSTNNGISKSASVARLNLDFESDCLVTISYINYAEENYDYGMFGKLDTAIATDGLTASSGSSSPSDSTTNYQLARCSNSTSVQTITYNVSAGNHFIDIKYGKDDATDSNNDTLQWKVTNIEATSAGGGYTYTITNVAEKHSLIFVFGDVNYYFINSTGTNCKLFPDGQQVKLEGHSYRIDIVPSHINDEVTLKDNNVVQSLTKETGYDKDNNPIVSYYYELSNIQTGHDLVISSITSISAILSLKINGTWIPIEKLWVKQDNRWIEEDINYLSTQKIKYLKRG